MHSFCYASLHYQFKFNFRNAHACVAYIINTDRTCTVPHYISKWKKYYDPPPAPVGKDYHCLFPSSHYIPMSWNRRGEKKGWVMHQDSLFNRLPTVGGYDHQDEHSRRGLIVCALHPAGETPDIGLALAVWCGATHKASEERVRRPTQCTCRSSSLAFTHAGNPSDGNVRVSPVSVWWSVRLSVRRCLLQRLAPADETVVGQ